MKKLVIAAALLFLAGIASAQDKKISDLPDGSPGQATDAVPIARGGANYRLPFSAFTTTFPGGTITAPILLPDGSFATPAATFSSDPDTGIYLAGANTLGIASNNTAKFTINGSGTATFHNIAGEIRTYANNANDWRIASGGYFGWSSSMTNASSTLDLALFRDAANTLALRNGANQQKFSLYNTFTDSSNYERLSFSGTSGSTVSLTAETSGTGADNLDIALLPSGSGGVVFPAGSAASPSLRFSGATGSNVGIFLSSGSGTASSVAIQGTQIRLSNAGGDATPGIAIIGSRIKTGLAGALEFTSGNADTASDASLTRDSSNTLQLGADAATATAQTLKGPDSTGSGTIGGSLTLKGGSGTSGDAAGGNLFLTGGGASGTGVAGKVVASSPVLLSDATNTTPALCFAGDDDGTCAGWYRESGNMWTLTYGSGGNLGNYRFAPTYFNFAPQQFGLGGNVGAPYVLINAEAANTLALRNGANAQTFNIYNTYTDGSNYERGEFLWSSNELKIGTRSAGTGSTRGLQLAPANSTVTFANASYVKFFNIENNTKAAYPETSDDFSIGYSTKLFNNAYISRSIQGSKSKALTDNTPTTWATISVADDDYEGCGLIWTAFAEDADTDSRQTLTGRNTIAILNNSGTESCATSTGDVASNVPSGSLSVTFNCTAGSNQVNLEVRVDTSLNGAAETLTFEGRLDCPSSLTTLTFP